MIMMLRMVDMIVIPPYDVDNADIMLILIMMLMLIILIIALMILIILLVMLMMSKILRSNGDQRCDARRSTSQ